MKWVGEGSDGLWGGSDGLEISVFPDAGEVDVDDDQVAVVGHAQTGGSLHLAAMGVHH